ncbi:hypothetical protein [Lactococcus muris]|uniref:hypothetical protein n=1 Tax=Lactococcus muris TaxID=2941330 RepID=UPI00373FD47B
MQVPIKYIVTICQWEIKDKYEVKVIKENFTVRLLIRPLNLDVPAWTYTRDLEELGLTHTEVKNELYYLSDILSNNATLVDHIYKFCMRTKASLGMAFIAWHMDEMEQEEYIRKLRKTYVLEFKEERL